MSAETSNISRRIVNRVGVICIERPESMNSLNQETLREILQQCETFDGDDSVGCILIHGANGVFSAGGDISEMKDKAAVEAFAEDLFVVGQQMARIRKPIVAAVNGHALGGGCELAMACDLIIAASDAKFGQPEIKLGIIPGMGGTQRLTRAIGKAKAMDMCLTGRTMSALEAESVGLVARVVETSDFLQEAQAFAADIAAKPLIASMMAKEAVNAVAEMPLSQGLLFERRAFQSLFSTHDQSEGMSAFVEKRKAKFTHS